MRSLSIASTGMLAQQLNVEVISNNLANMNTTAFKRQRAEFQDLLYQDLQRVGTASTDGGSIVPSGVQIGVGVKAGSTYRIMEQGNLKITDGPLDLAIQGDGWFRVLLPNGDDSYTRAGSFALSPTGAIVTAEGYEVQPSITIPQDATNVTINSSGEVLVSLDGQVAAQNVGQLEMAIFFNEAGLSAMGDNLFKETEASGAAAISTPGAAGYGTIIQGFLETANVNSVTEITSLITAQRAYEMNAKVITTSDEMLSVTSNLK